MVGNVLFCSQIKTTLIYLCCWLLLLTCWAFGCFCCCWFFPLMVCFVNMQYFGGLHVIWSTHFQVLVPLIYFMLCSLLEQRLGCRQYILYVNVIFIVILFWDWTLILECIHYRYTWLWIRMGSCYGTFVHMLYMILYAKRVLVQSYFILFDVGYRQDVHPMYFCIVHINACCISFMSW